MCPRKTQLHLALNSHKEMEGYLGSPDLILPLGIELWLWVQFLSQDREVGGGGWGHRRSIRGLDQKLSSPLCHSSGLKYVLGELLGIVL